VAASPAQGLVVACGAGQVLQIDIAALYEGYFTGAQLVDLGLQTGEVLGALNSPVSQPASS